MVKREFIKDEEFYLASPDTLIRAIENREFTPWFQPVFSSENGKIAGCEVLVRWEHPDVGVIPPEQFIPHLETGGLIALLTSVLMEQTVDTLGIVSQYIPDNFHVGINISADNLSGASLEQGCIKLLNIPELHNVKLVLELTERERFPDTPDILVKLKRLKEYGILLALDDFGTGYSSYHYLQEFPLDFIKIDKSFIQQMETDGVSMILVDNIIHLAKKLGIGLVAEGVETANQARLVAGKGVHYLQGYLFSPPLPGNMFIRKYFDSHI